MGTHPIFESDFDCLTVFQRMVELWWHPVSPPARAVELAAKYAGVDVDRKYLDLFKGEQMAPEFLKINPQHCVPTLRDGSLIMWESRACIQYLFNKYKPGSTFYPHDAVKRAKIDFLLCWDAGTLYDSLSKAVYPQLGFRPKTDEFENDVKNFKEKLQFLNDHLIVGPYLTGENITAADISVSISLTMATITDGDDMYKAYPKLNSFLDKMKSEEHYKTVDAEFQKCRAEMIANMKK